MTALRVVRPITAPRRGLTPGAVRLLRAIDERQIVGRVPWVNVDVGMPVKVFGHQIQQLVMHGLVRFRVEGSPDHRIRCCRLTNKGRRRAR